MTKPTLFHGVQFPRHRPTLSGLLLLMLLSACKWSTGLEGGTYTATITGAVDTTLAGRAALERGVGLDEFEYAVHMFLPDRGPEFGIYLFFAERPQQGTYKVTNVGAPFLERDQVSAFINVVPGNILGTSGEVRITSTRPLQGTFNFVEEVPSRERAQVQGEFRLR